MKTAIKVLNILTIVGCAIAMVIILFSSCAACAEMPEYGSVIGGAIFLYEILLLVPIIVCAIANSKVANAYSKSELTGIAIITLLLGNLISGILMLVITDEDLRK